MSKTINPLFQDLLSLGYEKKAMEAKVEQCIKTISSKTDPFYDSCDQYATSLCVISDINCTNKGIKGFCEHIETNVTSKDKREYCQSLIKTNDEFWKAKFS